MFKVYNVMILEVYIYKVYIYSEMISTVRLVNTFITSRGDVVRIFNFFFFFLVDPVACRSPGAGNQTQATVVTVLGPQPAGP